MAAEMLACAENFCLYSAQKTSWHTRDVGATCEIVVEPVERAKAFVARVQKAALRQRQADPCAGHLRKGR